MSPERMMQLLRQIIDHTAVDKNCEETIIELLCMGFTGEELFEHFYFNLSAIADAMEKMEAESMGNG